MHTTAVGMLEWARPGVTASLSQLLQNLVSQIIPLAMYGISFCLWLVQKKRNLIQNPSCVPLAIKCIIYRLEVEESISYSHNISSEQRSQSTFFILGSALDLHGKVWVTGGLLLQSCQLKTMCSCSRMNCERTTAGARQEQQERS